MSEDRAPHYAEPKKPRLLWNQREKRRVAEPLPSQTVEVVNPFYNNPAALALDMRHDAKPENRLI